ncbi:hypothetical protein, partial [Paenibacillus lemnae]|uniref:hypothetical protein n=1 Tax=Paenibacillus lemnae TaxID=1330551 RepID=UPI001B7D4E03
HGFILIWRTEGRMSRSENVMLCVVTAFFELLKLPSSIHYSNHALHPRREHLRIHFITMLFNRAASISEFTS